MKRVASVLAALLVVGCTSVPLTPAQPDESGALLDKALKRIEDLPAGTKSADAKVPPAKVTGASNISVSYAGEARTLLRQIAVARGIQFKVRGPEPHLPLFVIVDVKNVTLVDFLADVGAQFGQRASLALTNDAIEVRYRAP